MRLGIKAKQVAGVVSIVGAVVVGLSVIHLSSLARVQLHESHARGDLLAQSIFQLAREVVRGQPDPYAALRDDPGLRSILHWALSSPGVTYAAIVDPKGVAVAHSDPSLEGRELPKAGDLEALLGRRALAHLRAPGCGRAADHDARDRGPSRSSRGGHAGRARSRVFEPHAVHDCVLAQARRAGSAVRGRRARGEESAERDDDSSRAAEAEAAGDGLRKHNRRAARRRLCHGVGLGLSMVYRIVQMHDGEIEVQSTYGHGTTFRLALPQA